MTRSTVHLSSELPTTGEVADASNVSPLLFYLIGLWRRRSINFARKWSYRLDFRRFPLGVPAWITRV